MYFLPIYTQSSLGIWIRWSGIVEWNGGVDYWSGVLERVRGQLVRGVCAQWNPAASLRLIYVCNTKNVVNFPPSLFRNSSDKIRPCELLVSWYPRLVYYHYNSPCVSCFSPELLQIPAAQLLPVHLREACHVNQSWKQHFYHKLCLFTPSSSSLAYQTPIWIRENNGSGPRDWWRMISWAGMVP